MILPGQSKRWIQTNQSDLLGNLWSTFNIDLTSNVGRLRVSPRMMLTMSEDTDADFTGAPVGFKLFNSRIYTSSNAYVWYATAVPGAVFTQDSATSTPSNCGQNYSDLEVFNGKLYVSSASTVVNELDSTGATWTTVSGLTGSTPHLMCQYANRLYVTDADFKIKSYSGSGGALTAPSGTPNTAAYTLDLTSQTSNYITFIKAASNRIWIGTINLYGNQCSIYEWDGAAAQPLREYIVEARGVISCVIKDDIPYVVDSEGRLLSWSSGHFTELARLPLDRKYLANASRVSQNLRFIHPNGMAVDNGRILLFINNEYATSGNIPETCPSGIWEYDSNNGLYHKYSLSVYPLAGGTITDYGHNRISRVGALAALRDDQHESTNGRLICGAIYFTNATASKVAAFVDESSDTVQKSGYFILTKSEGENIQENWNKAILSFKQLASEDDKIQLKYRTTEAAATEATITWTSTTTFTTSTSFLGKEGYEVEITAGVGAGKTAHITQVDVTGATYTVTLDETFTSATGTGKARVQNWTKGGTFTSDTVAQIADFMIDKTSTWLQVKVCLTVTGKFEIDNVFLINTTNQLAK